MTSPALCQEDRNGLVQAWDQTESNSALMTSPMMETQRALDTANQAGGSAGTET